MTAKPNKMNVKLSPKHNELYKILKFNNLVQSGGEAKFVIAEGLVKVNGKIETRKRKKIQLGDVIEFNDLVLEMIEP
ncbi:MAG: RNA-binding S4 domain-containing protein [bacterium]|nr:RNA-binding S4 domain-containing protein [bacterium]MBU1919169.1 RNA-binding S4 domain-containing protein [bacterium]